MNYIIYIVQAVGILFALALAKHDGAAVNLFEKEGVDNKTMSQFHRYNVWSKFCFCIISALAAIPNWLNAVIYGTLSSLWIYLLFDIILNKSRGKGWDYIGMNDADGRWWINKFGNKAGELKALILFGLILVINTLIILL